MRTDPQLPQTGKASKKLPARGPMFQLAALLLAVCTMTTATGFLMVRWLRVPDGPSLDGAGGSDNSLITSPNSLNRYFVGWNKPDFVLLLTGQQHGYVLPCGCSEPQYGGLERLYNFVQTLKNRGWPVAAVDLGDIAQKRGPVNLPNVQGVLKYRYSMDARRLIGYSGVTFGEYEAAGPLNDCLDSYALNNPSPRVLSTNWNRNGPNGDPLPDETQPWEIYDTSPKTPWKVGVFAANDAAVQKKIKDLFNKADFVDKTLLKALAALEKANLRVLLYQGSVIEAKKVAKWVQERRATEQAQMNRIVTPSLDVILCLSEEDEPPGLPDEVGNTMIVRVGHKGKHLGVVGVFSTGKPEHPFELRYQLATLSPDFSTPTGKENNNPVLSLMEAYTRELQKDDYLHKYGQSVHPVQFSMKQLANYAGQESRYIGSEACKKCHESAYKVWQNTPHSHAYKTLVDAARPSLRQFDGECIVCHVTGFTYKTGFADAVTTPKLINVGCESCHGPCSLHKENPNDLKLRELINPWRYDPDEKIEAKKKVRLQRIEQGICIKCHDIDNDVHWTMDKWDKRKLKIVHHTVED